MSPKSIKYLIVFVSVSLCQILFAQTEIINGMKITGNVRWYGTKIIKGDVTVLPTARLVITPGTKILFSANSDVQRSGNDKTKSELIVKGVLIAQGELGNKILFSSDSQSPRMGDWYGIIFHKVTEQSILDYCIVEYAYDGITIKKSKIQVSNSEVRYNYHSGLSIEVKSNPKISSNIISENDYAGIICTLGATPILSDNLITSNNIGIVILSSSQPNLGMMQKGNNYNQGGNRIMQNSEYDIYNHSNKNIFAENNIWSSDKQRDIAQSIFDRTDDSKFGSVDYNPLFKPIATRETVDNLLLLAQYNQNPNEPRIVSENQSETKSNDNNQLNDTTSQAGNQLAIENALKQDLTNPVSGKGVNQKDSIKSSTIPVKQLENETPILASSQPKLELKEPEVKTQNQTIMPAVDYNNIFLEAFLDGGKKEYISKEKIQVNEILRRTMQSGVVRIQVIVAKNGRVESAKILKGFHDILDEAALEAAKKFRYKPGTVNNQQVRFRTIEVFIFSA